jgi:hypothetical protein
VSGALAAPRCSASGSNLAAAAGGSSSRTCRVELAAMPQTSLVQQYPSLHFASSVRMASTVDCKLQPAPGSRNSNVMLLRRVAWLRRGATAAAAAGRMWCIGCTPKPR